MCIPARYETICMVLRSLRDVFSSNVSRRMVTMHGGAGVWETASCAFWGSPGKTCLTTVVQYAAAGSEWSICTRWKASPSVKNFSTLSCSPCAPWGTSPHSTAQTVTLFVPGRCCPNRSYLQVIRILDYSQVHNWNRIETCRILRPHCKIYK